MAGGQDGGGRGIRMHGFTSTDMLVSVCIDYGLETSMRHSSEPPGHDEASFEIHEGHRFVIRGVSKLTVPQWKRIRSIIQEISPYMWTVNFSGDRELDDIKPISE